MKINEITSIGPSKPAKISNVRPGQSAEIDHGDGTKTVVDLKKANLVKDPKTKKVKVQKNQSAMAIGPASVKTGDQVDLSNEN